MSDTMVEALENVLRRRLMTALPGLYRQTGPPEGTSLRVCAEECLRQMEWAREHGCQETLEEYVGGERRKNVGPLTIAPDDWTP